MENSLQTLGAMDVAITTAFNTSLAGVETSYDKISMTVNSTTLSQGYPKLDEIPKMREWLGSRVINRLNLDAFQIKNRKFENTISINVDDIADDQVGIFSTVAQGFGEAARELPDEIMWEKLLEGFDTVHFDGQNFFDTEHPVIDETGEEVGVSNLTDGPGNPWFLMDTTKVIKPMIFQDRLAPEIRALMNVNDPNVVFNDEYIWAAKRRCAAGFGAWQTVHASKQPLTPENYEAAVDAMTSMTGPEGRKLALRPNLLVVGSSNRSAAKRLLKAALVEGGNTNVNYEDVDLHVETRLN